MIRDLSGCAVLFPNRPENVKGYGKKIISHAMCFHFLYTFVSETHSRKLQDTFARLYPNFGLSQQILIKVANVKISRKSVSGSRVVP